MHISKARKLKTGDKVKCPQDGSWPAFIGEVTRFNKDLTTQETKVNIYGKEYIWVEVKGIGSKALWPSNRLG